MKDDRTKIFLPKDPYQIGVTPKGEMVWVDPHDFIPTPEEKLEQKDNMLKSNFDGNVEKISIAVMRNAEAFVAATILQTAGPDGFKAFEDGESATAEWTRRAGFSVIQDGLKTIMRVKDRVIRELNADVDIRFREAVIKRINQKVKEDAQAA